MLTYSRLYPMTTIVYFSVDFLFIVPMTLTFSHFYFPVDFVLKDPREKDEDKKESLPAHREELLVVPKPWNKSFVQAMALARDHLHVTNPCMQQVLQLWHTAFSYVKPHSVFILISNYFIQ